MINWNEINTVFLDMDGTLLDLHYDNYFWLSHLPKRYAQKHGLGQIEAEAKLKQMYLEHNGTLNWYCLEFWSDELKMDLMPLKHEVADRIAYRPNAKVFLEALHRHNYHVVLVTNAHRGSIEVKFQYTDLERYLHDLVCSHDYDSPKESQVFWNNFRADKPFDNQKTVFFDDNETVLRAAAQAGLKHLVSIASPDSQQVPRESSEFPLIHDFSDVTPNE